MWGWYHESASGYSRENALLMELNADMYRDLNNIGVIYHKYQNKR